MRQITSLSIIFYLLVCKAGFATVLIVNNNSNAPVGHYPTIQAAITVGNSGDTIYVVGSPTNYGSFYVWPTPKTFVLIGAGYRPQKDNNYSSKIDDIAAGNIFNNGNDFKIFGFEIFGTIGKDMSSCCGGNGWEIAYNKFNGTNARIFAGDNCNIHDNYFEVPFNGGSSGAIQFLGTAGCQVYNNIFSRLSGNVGVLIRDGRDAPFNSTGNLISHNHFLSASGGNVFGYLYNSTVENNLFYGYSIADTMSIAQPQNTNFNNNLTDYAFNPFGNNTFNPFNHLGEFQLSQFQNPNLALNGAFDFPPFDYKLTTSSVGHEAGTDNTDIGAFGGANPFSNYTGMYHTIPQITKLDLYNTIVGQADSLKFHTIGYANTGDSIIAMNYFFDADTSGNYVSIPITAAGNFNFYYSIDHDSLGLGPHVIGLKTMNSHGTWSFPEIRSFTVCTISGSKADFDFYVYGKDVIFANKSTDQQTCLWNFGDTDTSNQSNLVHHYDSAGIFNTCLIAKNVCKPAGDTICKQVAIKGINSIFPVKGGNTGIIAMTITGAVFNDSTKVRLIMAGHPDINSFDSSFIQVNGTTIRVFFDLTGADIGQRDVIIEVPGDTTYTVINGFEIDTTSIKKLQINLIGPPSFRRLSSALYTLTITNPSNIDAISVPVWIMTPDFINFSPTFLVVNPSDPTINWDTIPQFVINDTAFGVVSQQKVYAYKISYIPAGGSIDLKFIMRSQINATFKIRYWFSKPTIGLDTRQFHTIVNSSNCEKNENTFNCFKDLITNAIGGISPEVNCAAQIIAWDIGVIYQSLCHPQTINTKSIILDLVAAFGSCAIGFSPWERYDKVRKVIKTLLNFYSPDLGHGASLSCLDAIGPEEPHINEGSIISSIDPNLKYGNSGILNSLCSQSKFPLNYEVHFENTDTATASAQKIIIIDTIDRANLDLSTFQLTEVGFGDTIIFIPAGRKSFTADIDLRPTTSLIARIAAYLDSSTGIFKGSLISLDPLTMLPTDSVFLGILPPNDSTGRGEGFISYSIKAKEAIATGTTINNKADIYFDNNAPIPTPTWTIITDDLKPQSQVSSLPLVMASDSIIVHWSGSDNGPAGLYGYNVYYNINGGEWRLWKYSTSLTTDTLVGSLDSTYGFYCIAIDSALNIENKFQAAEAVTTISHPVPLNLLSFNAKKEGKHNLLSWNTSQEVNTDRFEVLRSITGSSFDKIGVVKAGSSNYTFSDDNPANAINYYRLKLVDKDANFSYSTMRSVNNIKQNLIIYPNPVLDKNLTLNFSNTLAEEYILELYSLDGKLIFNKKFLIGGGSLNQVIKLPAVIAKGSYIVKLLSANKTNVLQQLVYVE